MRSESGVWGPLHSDQLPRGLQTCIAWAPLIAVMYHRQYKWIWLNRGDGSHVVQQVDMGLVKMWDEIQAGV